MVLLKILAQKITEVFLGTFEGETVKVLMLYL
jgi:hypothetical protein